MKFINLGLEDGEEGTNTDVPQSGDDVNLNPNETQEAAKAIENEDSTEPAKQLQVANYKEELAILQQQQANEQTDDNQDEANPAPEDGPDDGIATSPENPQDTPDENPNQDENQEPTDNDNGDEENADDESEEDVDNTEPEVTDSEMGKGAVGKDAEQVAQEQYIVKGFQEVSAALESVQVMAKYHTFLSKRSDLGGISHHTANVINTAFEHHSLICGYKPQTPTPALESYDTYTGSAQSTGELKIAIEGFLDTVWEAIKKFFKGIWTWLMDVLSPKQASVTAPADKGTRDKALKELEKDNERLKKTIEKMDLNRQRDADRKAENEINRARAETREANARLGARVAAQLFKTSDKGSFSEMTQNVRMLAEVVQAAHKHAVELVKVSKNAGSAAIGARVLSPNDLAINKNQVTGITFNSVERGNKSSLVEAKTDEILGGIGARFMFAGTDTNSIGKTIGASKVMQELGHQGFKMTSVKEKSGFPNTLPALDSGDIQHLNTIVTEVSQAYAALTQVQAVITELAKVVKGFSEGGKPQSWNNLSQEDIAVIQMQMNFVGLIETNLVSGYKSMSDQVNNFTNAYRRLVNMIVPS